MAQFCEIKKSGQKLKSLGRETDGEKVKCVGFKTDLTVEITGMQPSIFNNGELLGEIPDYQAGFTVRNNRVFGFKTMQVQILENTEWQNVDNLPAGDIHKIVVTGSGVFAWV